MEFKSEHADLIRIFSMTQPNREYKSIQGSGLSLITDQNYEFVGLELFNFYF